MDNLKWWWELVSKDSNWNSLPPSTKSKLVDKLQQVTSHFAKVNISKEDIQQLLDDVGDSAIVFDAILSSWCWPEEWRDNKFRYLINLKREIVLNFQSIRVKENNWFVEKKNPHKSNKPPVSLETVEKHNPFNFKKCECGAPLVGREKICKLCRVNRKNEQSSGYRHKGGGRPRNKEEK